ncbi:MAG: class I SAM-dependent methyltransferase [Thermodesulfobacteriota bacterium]
MIGISEFKYRTAEHNCAHKYLLPKLIKILNEVKFDKDKNIFELGCGNGSVANFLYNKGYKVTGVDPSKEGIVIANKKFPHINLKLGSCYDDLQKNYGQFNAVISLEVIEHVFEPHKYAACVFDLLKDGGSAIISTPYHGYLKNVALSITGKMDDHFTALWDYGHIKFWSKKTLRQLLNEVGFADIRFLRVGRIPILAKSMIAVANKGKT